jgi:hypothetical protein
LRITEDVDVRHRRDNPVDVVEFVAACRAWTFERSCDDEIEMSVAGQWTDYSVSFAWVEEREALHLGCAFPLAVPAEREIEVLRLLATINAQLLAGHFDIWPKEDAIMFRHALLLTGGAQATQEQAERLLSTALESCERFHQAFGFVISARKTAAEALTCSLFETVGNA